MWLYLPSTSAPATEDCASALGVAVFVSADLVINPSQTMRIETSA